MMTKLERNVKTLHTDNGREYIDHIVQEFLKEHGIVQQFSVRHTPQQNGIAEWKNRSLVDMARCMLLDSKLAKMFWAEAVLHATYLQNTLPMSNVEKMPYELFAGKKPDVHHLRVFGARIFAHLPKELRRKLKDRAQEGVLWRYCQCA